MTSDPRNGQGPPKGLAPPDEVQETSSGKVLAFPGQAPVPEPETSDNAEAPPEVHAWMNLAQDDHALHDKLRALARELSDHDRRHSQAAPTPRPIRRSLRWALLAAALLLGGSWIAQQRSTPIPHPLAEAPEAQPTPAPSPPPIEFQGPLPQPKAAPAAVVHVDLPTPATEPPPPPARRYASKDSLRLVRPLPDVEVMLQGELTVGGTHSAPELSLVGSAIVDVTPDVYQSLVVESVAARVHVLGTRFSITEQASGTTVQVERGKVDASCAARITARQAQLEPGAELFCPTPTSNGLYVYARKLQREQAPKGQVLTAVEQGLSYPAETRDMHDLLEVMRIQALADLGRKLEAQVAVRAYLDSDPSLHVDDMQALANGLGVNW